MAAGRLISRSIVMAALAALACGCVQPGFGKHADLVRADASSASVPQNPPRDGVRVTYFGTASFLLESRDGAVLVDPYFSRFDSLLLRSLGLPLKRDPDRIADLLDRLPPRVDYIVVTHGHYDHLFDVPDVAVRTGAKVLLSPTSFYQAAAAGLPEERMMVVRPSDRIGSDDLRVTAFQGDHAPQVLGIHLYAGSRDTYPKSTRRAWHWKDGQTLTFLIEMGGQRIFVSSGSETSLPPICGETASPPECIRAPVDLALLGVAVEKSRDLMPRLVDLLEPRVIQPTHQDDFARPIADGFHYGLTADMDAVRRAWGDQGRPGELVLLDYGRPWTLR